MRPIKLEMTAFGPYKDHTVVDFDRLGNGIYAITGPTGAGKTTIFDAMMFALYEQVSSQNVDSKTNPVDKTSVRNKNMVRSHYSDRKTDTLVRLRFEERGETYTVTRTIHAAPSSISFRAELEGSDIAAVKDSKKVTAEIERILGGMDATRFRQIVMLAQGQFRAFMEAKDDQRKEILEKIFDTEPYRIFQDRLHRVSAKLNEQKKEKENEIRLKLRPDVFLLPEETTDEERACYCADLPWDVLERNIKCLTDIDREKKAVLDQKLEQLDGQLKELNQQIGAAREENERYKELQQKRERLEILSKQEKSFADRQILLEETEKAYHQVKPSHDKLLSLKEEVVKKKTALSEKKEKIEDAAKAYTSAQEDQKKNEERRRQISDLEKRAERIREHLGDFEQLASVQQDLKKAEKALKKAEEQIDAATKQQEEAKKTLEVTAKALEALKDAEVKENSAKTEYKNASEFLEKLSHDKNGIRSRAEELSVKENSLTKLLAAAKKAKDQAEKAVEDYRSIHQSYLNNYAGKLGTELEKELEVKEVAYCPVCRSAFHKGEAHTFAGLTAETITEKELKAAEQKKNKLEKESAEATNQLTIASTAFESSRVHLTDELKQLLPREPEWTWDKKITIDQIDRCIAEAKEEKRKKEDSLTTAQKAVLRKDELEETKKELETICQSAADAIHRGTTDKSKAQSDQTIMQAEAARFSDNLKQADMQQYRDKKAAESFMDQLIKEKNHLEAAVNKADQNLKAAADQLNALMGEERQQEKEIKDKEKETEEARKVFAQTIEQYGFPSETDYQKAIERTGRTAPDRWIASERDAVSRFYNEKEQVQNRIREMEKKQPVYIDLNAMDEEIVRAKTEQKELQEQDRTLRNQAESHRSALRTLREVSSDLRKLEAACRRITNLSGVAGGETASGGKRSFDGYVLGSTFREVLDHATRYLDEMTGGKYSLCHSTEAAGVRKNTSANFVIMVQDALTGREREIGSLSGGESFQVAMALALGLSDTVQSHVSTVNIDTMFIDEGFGTLDSLSLQRMLHVLTSLSDGSRQIGIISHVDELKESIGKFIHVTASKDDKGSHLRIEV